MHVLDTKGLPLGEIVVIDQGEPVDAVRRAGIPYIIRPGKMKDDKILKTLLFGVITKRFPWLYIKPSKQNVELFAPVIVHGEEEESFREGGSVGASRIVALKALEEGGEIYSRDSYRYSGGNAADGEVDESPEPYGTVDLTELEDAGYLTVDTAELMDAGLLPTFLQDIGESIRTNLSNYCWADRWNRKLGAYLGEYELVEERPNLIVLDISGSIPSGVAYTMVGLIETLRAQANADLIVNSGQSQWWPHDQPIDLNEINAIIGGCNEARQFYRILEEHVLGKKWGNIIGFGDWDSPVRGSKLRPGDVIPDQAKFASTEIGNVVGYHTCSSNELPGYLCWVKDCQTGDTEVKPKSWVKQIRRYY